MIRARLTACFGGGSGRGSQAMATDLQHVAQLLGASLDPRQNKQGQSQQQYLKSTVLTDSSGTCPSTGRAKARLLSVPFAYRCLRKLWINY